MSSTSTIPVFPLGIVVLPGESSFLHIFEPRYLQLIKECEEEGHAFAIPFTKNGQVAEYGTEVKLKKIIAKNEKGELDISIQGQRVVRINELFRPFPGRLYNGGLITTIENDTPANIGVHSKLSALLRSYLALKRGEDFKWSGNRPENSFDAALMLNLPAEQKYSLIAIESENERCKWLSGELQVMIQTRKQEIFIGSNFYLN